MGLTWAAILMFLIRADRIGVTGRASNTAQPLTTRIVKGSHMAKTELPSIEELRKLLAYDPETGVLTWRQRPVSMFRDGKQSASHSMARWNARYAMKAAFRRDPRGYLSGRALGRNMYAHRLAWALHHGEWPAGEIDHINGIRDDNRIANLRSVSRTENARNSSLSWSASTQKWHASIRANGRGIKLGAFEDFDAACTARSDAERLHGYHANHGRSA